MGEKEIAFAEEGDFRTPQSSDGCLLTEGGNFIGCYDKSFQCSTGDDYDWTLCGAESLSGENEDEVLIIESGNPKWCPNNKPGSSPGATLNYGPWNATSVKYVGPDKGSRLDGTALNDTEGWGTAQSKEQERQNDSSYLNGNKFQYKPTVVRRELVHGSYEEHVEGDRYTTIEGTWFSKTKGHLWNTYYGKFHNDYNYEYQETYYGDVTNQWGKDEAKKINVTVSLCSLT